jgi:hypothetical protein
MKIQGAFNLHSAVSTQQERAEEVLTAGRWSLMADG